MITTDNLNRPGPALVRVHDVMWFPFPELDSSKRYNVVLHLEVRHADGKVRRLAVDLMPCLYVPYWHVIVEAVTSGQSYWVDWDYSTTPDWPPRDGDTIVHRLLNALEARQIVRGLL